MNKQLAAAVDLGSNSFRLQVGRIVDNQIYPLDGLKETVDWYNAYFDAGKTVPDKITFQ